MANIIKPKRSNTGGAVPTTGQLASGELAVNMADKKVYINNGTAVVQVGAGNLDGLGDTNITSPTNGQGLSYNSSTGKWVNSNAGTGDVVGPASSTDNALARFDGTTGKLIQNGTVTQDDNGNLASVNGLSFNTSPTSAPSTAGSVFWDSGDGTPSVVLNANTSLQLGQESIAKVYNGTGSTIAKGKVVAVSGAQGQRPSVVLADADSEALSAPTLGITAEAIANGAEGFVCTFGLVRGINTSAFTAGNPIYLSSTAGDFTATKPVAPQHIVALGWVIKVNASSGEVFVNINNGWELDELHNVLITSPASGNTLIYDATAGVWKNANLTAGTGISVTNGAGSISIANTGVTSFSAGTTGLTPSTGTTGAVTLAGTLAVANGGTGATTAPTARTNLGATTIGSNLFTLTNPSAVTFPRFNADNTVSALTAADFRTAIGVGTGSGTVTSVATGTGLTGGPITSTGTISLANTAVTAGTYTSPSITVDAQGRLTAASSITFYNAEVLVIAGGGSGGATNGGGGGAGGLLYVPTILLQGGSSYTVTVGAGGAGSTSGGNNGNDSVFGIATATKGGAGSSAISGQSKNGGSGGGGRGETGDAGGTATTGQGNNGGNGVVSPRVSAGGGGKGGAGADGNSGGTGGSGTNDFTTWAIATSSGASNWFCGGGGGGTESVDRTAAGGTGGGGASGNQSNGSAGTANTGGGGGGGSRGSSSSGTYSGGSGGSGIVIVRYVGAQRGSGGTVYTVGGYTYHKFTSSGTYTG